MKMSRRILIVVVCLALLLSFSSPAFAAASQTFFTRNAYGYRCTGSGSISGREATAVFDAEALSTLTQTIPAFACTCETWVLAYDNAGNYIGASTTGNGTIHSSATYLSETTPIYRTYCSYQFNNTDFGGYLLFNS